MTKLIPKEFQPGNLWFWSFPSAGKEMVVNYRIDLLGIYLGHCPAPNCRKYFAGSISRSVIFVVTMVHLAISLDVFVLYLNMSNPS